MALSKLTYVDNVTVIPASNLNAIQDEVIANGTNVASAKSEVENIRVGADGTTYASAGDAVRGQISDLSDVITNDYKLFTSADMAQGAWYADGIHEVPNRICTKRLIPIKAGDKLVYTTSGLRIGFGLWVDGVLTEYHAWHTVSGETTYIFQNDGEFFAQFAASDDGNIAPSAYDAECKLYYGIHNEVSNNAEEINFVKERLGLLTYVCNLENGLPVNLYNELCVYSTNNIPVKYGDTITLETTRPLSASATKYIYGVYVYNSSGTLLENHSPASRSALTSAFIVDNANASYIKYAITEMDASDNIIAVRQGDFAGYETIAIVGKRNIYPYTYNGDYVDIRPKKYSVSASAIVAPSPTAVGAGAPQGFAMYNGKAVQFYSNPSKCAIVDMADNTVIATLDGNANHGNSIDFFNEFESASDPFPLALVADGISNEAYKVRIQTSGITVKETIKFPIDKCGYYVSTMLDKFNNIIYTVGYYENSYNTNSGSNKMIIAKWDYGNLTVNEDSSVTPAFIESFYVPYFTTLQGPTFYNGKLFIISSKASASEADTKIYVIDPYGKRVMSVMDKFADNIKNIETEALYFYEDKDGVVGYLKNGDPNMPYYKMIME